MAMPKVVDHEQRRRQIADAMWRVIAREGMAAASARSVAAEGAWSLGAVRYYFTSQDELLRFAIDQMIEGVTARVRHQWRTGSPGEERCRRVLEELLPFDERRTGEVRVWLAALVQSQVDPSLTDLCQAGGGAPDWSAEGSWPKSEARTGSSPRWWRTPTLPYPRSSRRRPSSCIPWSTVWPCRRRPCRTP